MRIRRLGHVREIGLKYILVIGFQNLAQSTTVTLRQFLSYFIVAVAGQFQTQHTVLDSKTPNFIKGCYRGRIRRFLPIQFDVFIDGEIHLGNMIFDSIDRINHPFDDALVVQIVNIETWLDTPILEGIVQGVAVITEFVDICLEKIQVGSVQAVEVAVKDNG